MGILDHLTCLLKNLYVGQEATVRIRYGTTDCFKIERGVRQGCILSSCLFIFYAELLFSCSVVSDSGTPWTAAHQDSLSFTISQSLLKLKSTESVMPSNHLITCHPLLLMPSIFPSIRVFSSGSALCIKWPNYWTVSFSINPSNEYSGLISFGIDWHYAEYIMWNARLDESQALIKIWGNINSLTYADDDTLMAASEEELKNLLMRVKEESEKAGLKISIKKPKIMASGPITSWHKEGEKVEAVTDFIFLNSKSTDDSNCSNELKICLFFGRKTMTNLDTVLRSRDITFLTKVHWVKSIVFPVVMCRELDHKEGWVLKNWGFQTVVLEKTPERSWTARR